MRLTPSLPACLALSFVFSAASAADGPPPPTVSQPSGINLGGTSFYDGFAGPPGLTHQTYLKFSTSSSIRDNGGKDNRNFDNPKINVITLINQFSYYSPDTIGGGAHLGWSLLVPVVSLDGDFGDNGVKLKDNGVGLGDVTVGPQIQFDPIVNAEGRPVFVQRVAFDTILPTGKYDKHKDLNPGSNYFSFNPYWAATWMPAPRWEMSWRLNYLYNFKNDDPASSSAQVFEGQPVRDTQAGQSAWANFTVSYEVFPKVSLGINGYYFRQITDDQANGDRLSNSREKVLGIGPGLFWKINEEQAFWLNTYKETGVENRSKTDYAMQVRYVHKF
ncbi:hypothetical protein PsexTeo8_38310 [Pseudomonas extremaustralis]|uniref:SphA family protein n=1 Tax=Pseudomonas extremaustralis TaxID=359110 RepID=UPI002AA0C41A|nr:transporter [Pseudomonas extremaustralis]MDY7067353.1 hypothetical protein [Pseudomonas extremaustralis]